MNIGMEIEFYKGYTIKEKKQTLEQMSDTALFSKRIGYLGFIAGVSIPVVESKHLTSIKQFCRTNSPREIRKNFSKTIIV